MLHGAQFIVSEKAIEHDGFSAIQMKDGRYLSVHYKLDIDYDVESDIYLLGSAWQTVPGLDTPVNLLDTLKDWGGYQTDFENKLLSMEATWSGRYVIIAHGKVYLDATGLMGVFYSGGCFSSSLTLLSEHIGLPIIYPENTSQLNYIPGPLTQFDQIKRLLPSQIYDYRFNKLHARQLLPQNRPHYIDEKERISEFIRLLSFSIKNMRKMFNDYRILVALTGGYDSRTVAALAKYSGVDFECFTLEHDKMTVGDTEIPNKICAALNQEYVYLKRNKSDYSSHLDEEYRIHTCGMADDADRGYYAHRQYQKLQKNGEKIILLRGSIWEISVEYYRKFIRDTFDEKTLYEHYAAKTGSIIRKSLEEYMSWCRESSQDGLNDCNRFYWEIREGCWLSSIEQGFDLLENVISVHPVNCRWLIGILMDFPIEERITKLHEKKISVAVCPQLKDIPYGDCTVRGMDKIKSLFIKVNRMVFRLKSLGFKDTITMYFNIIRTEKETKRLMASQMDHGKEECSKHDATS